MSLFIKVQANKTVKKIFDFINKFKDLKEKKDEIPVEEQIQILTEMMSKVEEIEQYIDLFEEEIDKLIIRNFVDCQDDICRYLNELTRSNTL